MKVRNCVFTLLIILVLSACFSPFRGPDASLTINLGRNNRAAYPPDDETFSRLVHKIELSGPSGAQSHELSGGTSSITINIDPGTWTITVTASLDGEPYAEGSASTEVTGGSQVSVAITMRQTDAPGYTVSFNSNGGSAVESQTVKEGEKAARPTNPTLTGYGFVGWYTDEALSTAYAFDTAVNSDITLYAKWSEVTYTISFESNGGSGISAQPVGAGGKAVRPADPTLAGYGFVGWYREAALTNIWDFENDVVTADITLYAKWIEIAGTFTITYERITDAAPNITGPALKLSGTTAAERTVTLEVTGDFDSITWEMDNETYGEGVSFTLSVDPTPDNSVNYWQYDSAGTYVLTLIVEKDGVPYNKTFTFKVVE